MPETQTRYHPPAWAGAIDLCSPDLTTPDAAAAVSRIFGQEDAVTVAAWCAYQAREDGQEAGYRLWLSVFKQLRNASHPDGQ